MTPLDSSRSGRVGRSAAAERSDAGSGDGGSTRPNRGAAAALAATVRTTLGPNGMDKMLVGDDAVLVTNGGARVLDRLDVADPVARVVAAAAQSQRRRAGDGTTTTLLLAGGLLSEAESLLDDGLHPTAVVEGYGRAAAYARDRLDAYARSVAPDDVETLRNVAATTVTGRWDDDSTARFARLAVSAVRAVDFDLARLTLKASPGGELRDSERVDGLIVDVDASSTTVEAFGASRSVEDARVALVGAEVGVETPDGVGRVTVEDADRLDAFREHDREAREAVVRAVRDAGADVLVCQKSIDDEVRTRLARAGVLPVERTRQDEFDALARATGATPVQSVRELAPGGVGRAGAVRRRSVGPADLLVVTDCPGESRRSLLLRAGTEHVADETEHVAETCVDAVRLAREAGVVPGGGAAATALARDVSAAADGVEGRPQVAVRAFAGALERIPAVLATNAGRNPLDVLPELRARHDDGETAVGVGVDGTPRDVLAAGVVDPAAVLDRALSNAFEAAATVLRVDEVRRTAASDTGDDATGGDSGGGHAHRDTGGYPWAISH